ncbi:glutathione hydrolase 3 [Solanum pennellii]|uniref:Glutathione hydrolase n=1 Tax=Solanum pennellii TaxID=28526 RepID=A0ABM1FTI5_SOLPN|nr:glutathione hydrolase 3 [Solanum pennellii]
MEKHNLEAPLLDSTSPLCSNTKKKWSFFLCFLFAFIAIAFVGLTHHGDIGVWLIGDVNSSRYNGKLEHNADVVESEEAVVAADDGRCSKIGISMLKIGGHAVDAAVATALCLGVVNPMASGIGGGGFMVVRSSSTSEVLAIDMRETAPLAASQNMYDNNGDSKLNGALSMGVPGELAGLHAAWSNYGRLPWKTLFQPAIKLAREGFVVAPYLGNSIAKKAKLLLKDPGLRQVFAPEGKPLRAGEICHNVELSHSLELIAEQGPEAFYNGEVGEKLVEDVKRAGGILTMDDLRNYRVETPKAVTVNAMGYTIVGMPPPSSGTLGISLILQVLENYVSSNAAKGALGLHRMIEAMKHMLAVRMNLGDPDFVNISSTVSDMLSSSFAKEIQQKIFDNTTFPPEYYLPRWSQLRDHGTSHFCIVDSDRNAVSVTTTVNYPFGGGVLSPSTGIVLNNEMGDFSTPNEISPDKLPPAPANFIQPKKRPLSSMTPVIVLKDNQLAGVIGGSGGLKIIFAVLQVFINHFVLGMDPLAAVQSPRVYHELIPNVVLYENWTCIDGDHIELSDDKKHFLEERGHKLEARNGGAICQLIVQNLPNPPLQMGRRSGKEYKDGIFRGLLVAVSDPRKDGRPAAI